MIRNGSKPRIGDFRALFSDSYEWQEACLPEKAGRCDAAGTFTVTCKILRQVIRKGLVVWHVSGRITGEDVNTLRDLLEQDGGASTLDLKDVRLVDGEAVRLLAMLESNGARINNCPLYVREWIKREREAT